MSSADPRVDTPTARLERSLEHGRLAHAYLFAGPPGSGKETAARWLAQSLNCERAGTGRAAAGCGRCDPCRRVADGVHPDVYWVRPESKSRRITVDQIRLFEESIRLKSGRGGIKIGVLIDADCLNDQAANAFLKTLEEPPSQTVILLLTAEPQRLLPTVVSRCARLNFGRGTAATASPYRDRVLAMLQTGQAVGQSRVVSTYSLLMRLTTLLAELRNEIAARLEEDASDQADYAEIDSKVKEKLADQLAARIEGEYRAAREQVLEALYAWHADIVLCTLSVADELLTNRSVAAEIRRAAAGLDYERALANLDAVERMRDALSRSISEPLALEVGLLRMAG